MYAAEDSGTGWVGGQEAARGTRGGRWGGALGEGRAPDSVFLWLVDRGGQGQETNPIAKTSSSPSLIIYLFISEEEGCSG